MYMAKRIFKNKKLIRNLFFISLLLIIGFFLWATFFGKKRILEGNTNAAFQIVIARSLASSRCPALPEGQKRTDCVNAISTCDNESDSTKKNDCYNNAGQPSSSPGAK